MGADAGRALLVWRAPWGPPAANPRAGREPQTRPATPPPTPRPPGTSGGDPPAGARARCPPAARSSERPTESPARGTSRPRARAGRGACRGVWRRGDCGDTSASRRRPAMRSLLAHRATCGTRWAPPQPEAIWRPLSASSAGGSPSKRWRGRSTSKRTSSCLAHRGDSPHEFALHDNGGGQIRTAGTRTARQDVLLHEMGAQSTESSPCDGGQVWHNRPAVDRIRAHIRTNLEQFRPETANCGLDSANFGASSHDVGPTSAISGYTWPGIGQI